MAYAAPLKDMLFGIKELGDLDGVAGLPGLEESTLDMVSAILDEAGKFAGDVLSPLNRTGDLAGLGFSDGRVTTPDGWKAAYSSLVEMGWNSPSASPDHGGMGLPNLVNACIQEMFQGANMSFQLCPMLTQGAIEAIEGYASDDLKETYLPKLVTGEWTGTMNLTEPQAGSDLAAVRSTATPDGNQYRIKGQKIYITYGAHDLTENIVHLVLARLPDAPAGVRGISLFAVPQFLVNDNGDIGEENDVRCVSIEHKLGIHASPTCTLAFGDNGGAIGHLIGDPNRGLEYMFAMMNNARLSVGLQGIGVAEHAYQDALAYANDRKQGKASGAQESSSIIEHPDVRRMLGLMRARIDAARALALLAARSLDYAGRADDPEIRERHQRRVDLLIPIVKGCSTEMAIELTSLGVQVHGGMGYSEETGVAQHLRDARITTIYEGTTGIQALDLVGRKIIRDDGLAVRELVGEMRASASTIRSTEAAGADWDVLAAMVETAAGLVEEVSDWLTTEGKATSDAPNAAATDTMLCFGNALGGWQMAVSAHRAALRHAEGVTVVENFEKRARLAEFYAGQIFPEALARRDVAIRGSQSLLALSSANLS